MGRSLLHPPKRQPFWLLPDILLLGCGMRRFVDSPDLCFEVGPTHWGGGGEGMGQFGFGGRIGCAGPPWGVLCQGYAANVRIKSMAFGGLLGLV